MYYVWLYLCTNVKINIFTPDHNRKANKKTKQGEEILST